MRPEPTSPVSTSTSPALTSKDTSSNLPSEQRFLTSSTVRSPDTLSSLEAVASLSSLPIIMRTTLSGTMSSCSTTPTRLPSRSTVMRSDSAKTSSRRWEM